MIAAWLSMLGLAVGAGMGAGGLLNPAWAARLVRLREDRAGGFAEFRGTYGGLFLGAHAVALVLAAGAMGRSGALDAVAMGAAAVCAAMWIGTAIGRIVAMLRDAGAMTKFNQASVAFEAGLGLAILAPWLF